MLLNGEWLCKILRNLYAYITYIDCNIIMIIFIMYVHVYHTCTIQFNSCTCTYIYRSVIQINDRIIRRNRKPYDISSISTYNWLKEVLIIPASSFDNWLQIFHNVTALRFKNIDKARGTEHHFNSWWMGIMKLKRDPP